MLMAFAQPAAADWYFEASLEGGAEFWTNTNEGAFKMDDAAKKAGYQPPEIFDFDPDQYSGYIHQNTDDDESALESHDKFATFVFTP